MASTFATTGFDALAGYAQLLAVLLGEMALIALVVNPMIVYYKIRRNPFPLVLQCLRESRITAFSRVQVLPIFRSTWHCAKTQTR